MLLFTASCKLAPRASWFCIKMCTDQTHIQRDKVDPIYSFDRSVHPRQSVQEIVPHLTWRIVKILLAEVDAKPQWPPTKTQRKSWDFWVCFSRKTRGRQHSPRHYWAIEKSNLIPTRSSLWKNKPKGNHSCTGKWTLKTTLPLVYLKQSKRKLCWPSANITANSYKRSIALAEEGEKPKFNLETQKFSLLPTQYYFTFPLFSTIS